jgi:hypothetical protein
VSSSVLHFAEWALASQSLLSSYWKKRAAILIAQEFDSMESKRATKETGAFIYCIAIAMQANTHEIPKIN